MDKEKMDAINVKIPLELGNRFRRKIQAKYGSGVFRRGDLKKAIIEAIEDWIKKK